MADRQSDQFEGCVQDGSDTRYEVFATIFLVGRGWTAHMHDSDSLWSDLNVENVENHSPTAGAAPNTCSMRALSPWF